MDFDCQPLGKGAGSVLGVYILRITLGSFPIDPSFFAFNCLPILPEQAVLAAILVGLALLCRKRPMFRSVPRKG